MDRQKRIVIELLPSDTTYLTQLQDKFLVTHTGFKPKTKENLHCTLFHFGKVPELYAELLKYGAHLKNFDSFYTDFSKRINYLANKYTLLNTGLNPEKIEFFGYKSYALVLKLRTNYEITRFREELMQDINDQLVKWQMTPENIKNIYAQGRNFSHNAADQYQPHITLGYLQNSEMVELPKSDENLSIQFEKLKYLNVAKIE